MIYSDSDFIIWTRAADSLLWFQICNIIRDIQLFAAILFAYLIFVVSEMIRYSVSSINKKKIFLVGLWFFIVGIFMVTRETLVVRNINNEILTPDQWNMGAIVYVGTDMDMIFMILMALPLVLYLSAVLSLHKIKSTMEDEARKSKINRMIIRILLIPTGTVYFALVMTFCSNTDQFFLFFFGRSIWISAALFILSSQLKSPKKP